MERAPALVDDLHVLFPSRPESTAETIASHLRSEILRGRLAPASHVNEVQLAARLAMSRGPVREAVTQLVQEGLLVRARNRGTSVVDLSDADIADIYRARAAVEREAGRAVLRGPREPLLARLQEVLERMQGALRAGAWEEYALADLRFHKTIVDAAASERLSRIFGTLMAESLLCMRRFEGVYERAEALLEMHERLRALLAQGQEEPYVRELEWHLSNSVVTLTEPLTAPPGQAPAPGAAG